jgi:hypothetical protein
MRVIYQWQETVHLTTIADIRTWWQSPVYTTIDPIDQLTIDPLATK